MPSSLNACLKTSFLALAALGVAIGGPVLAEDAKPDMPALKKEAMGAIKGLVGNLKKELKAAMKNGGPVNAIEVCNTVAPSIAATQSTAHKLTIRRTAIKFRNPDNAPDDFERAAMESFIADIAAGKDAKTLQRAEIVKTSEGETFRFVKAIPMGEKPCVVCHGGNIKPEVKAEIEKRYPDDKAVGFKPGELRGAFSISKKL
ncbi:MAG: DUF3365 domain-containing protein [Alphaproteobacteria bacterium]|nr:DUF3365 domain-containing protein [Alphaproteobacteria bacterium]